MLNRDNLKEVEEILGTISRQRAHLLFLQHFSDFSEFFINTVSAGYEIEETFGYRAQPNVLPPLSFTIINSFISKLNNSNAQYHDEFKKFQFPFRCSFACKRAAHETFVFFCVVRGERNFSEPGSGAKRKGNDTKVRACFFEF